MCNNCLGCPNVNCPEQVAARAEIVRRIQEQKDKARKMQENLRVERGGNTSLKTALIAAIS